MLVDTHCHIHEADYPLDRQEVLLKAQQSDVRALICVGTSEQSSREAVAFARQHEAVYASVGVHPHDTKEGWESIATLLANCVRLASSTPLQNGFAPRPTRAPAPGRDRAADVLTQEQSWPLSDASLASDAASTERKLVAVGEIGLDYFYTHSPREVQIAALEEQIQWALDYGLPISFHVREAFEDFWPVFDNFHGIRGVLHSFTDTTTNLEAGLRRGLYVGVNGISTFTKDEAQKAMFAAIPLDKMLLETDAPFLTPVPFRGKINEPAFVREVAMFHASMRGISLEEIAAKTTANAHAVFAF